MGRGRSAIGTEVKNRVEEAFTSQYLGQELLRAQGLDPGRLANAAPMDDGIPPSMPTNVYLTAFLGSLNVEWDSPPIDDFVEVGVVGITPDGGAETIIEVRGQDGTVIPNLSYVNHTIRVKFRDLWGHESGWSTGVVGKPKETADYKFNLERARQEGNLTSLIPALNADLLAGENFAENAVRQISLAQPEHPNQLPLSEVDFDAWPVNMVWPPTDTDINGNRYITAQVPTGFTARIIGRNSVKWLELVRSSTATTGVVIPFADFKQRGVQPGKQYIASAYVQGAAGTRVRFGVGGATDEAGVSQLTIAQTDVVTLNGDPAGQRIFIKFTGDPTYTYIRLRTEVVDINNTVYWTRFQLEQADNKLEPSGWSPGIFSTGVINARMLSAIDANIANAIFKNAAIDSAAIRNMTADKITSGTIATTEIVVASLLRMASGGLIKAGNTLLDSGGLSLKPQSSYDTGAMTRDSKITDTTLERSAIAFYQNNSWQTPWNGIVMRADGDSSHDGIIALHATRGGDLTNATTARVELLSVSSGYAQVRVWQDLIAQRNVRGMGKVTSDGDLEAQGDVWGRRASGTWVSLLGHDHPLEPHNHHDNYVRLGGPGTSVQQITGAGIYVTGEISAGSYYYNKGGTWTKFKYDTQGYLWV